MIGETILEQKSAIGAGVFLALFLLERIFAARPAPAGLARLRRNGLLWLCLIAISPLIVVPLTKNAAEHSWWTRPIDWSAAALFADLVLLDLWTYFVHRLYHEVPMMRRLHRVHHLDEHLDTTSAVRFHPGEVALSAILRMAPIFLFAISLSHVLIFETLLLAASLFHHSNIRLPVRLERALSLVIVTPSIHWVHHHAEPADTNSNYAAVLSVWDPLFGTRSPAARTPEMKIGLKGVADKSAVGLMLLPFRAGKDS
jgi:sterol desaturase/sphingolipid hydroxylase (fatty acid hydroxylase superfamily)